MSTSGERIEVFQDTMDWIDKDPDLSASIPTAKKNTTVYYEDDYPDFDPNKTKNMTISVSGDRSYQAAIRLHKEMPDAKIAVMNFANAFHAGGGVTKGSSAQEECLCRTSTLYPLLYRRTLRDTFYKHHNDLNTPKASDSLVYTKGVIICKTDEDLPKRMPKEDWVTVDVITIAAPDLRKKSNIHAPLVNGGTYMNNAELFGYHVKRAIHMLTCAAANGADVLVLGAFGCGAFENDPEVVARAYKTVLQEFPAVFRHIEFAVYRPASGSKNYDVFKRVLSVQKGTSSADAGKFKKLIGCLARLENDEYTVEKPVKKHKGTSDDPLEFPYVTYTDAVHGFMDAVYDFYENNPDYELNEYPRLLEDRRIRDLDSADIDSLDLQGTLALLMWVVRGEKFCDGLIGSELKNGRIQALLQHLAKVVN